MRFVFFIFSLFLTFQSSISVAQEDQIIPTKFAELKTSKGKVYKNCEVIRIEVDSLVISYGNGSGMAKVSLFELSSEVQKQFNFDPIAGMKKYKQEQALQRELRWKRFWENEKAKIDKKAGDDLNLKIKTARLSWVPVQAAVVSSNEDGIFVFAKKITFVPTKVKSSLGLERDGPPVKKLVPFHSKVIFIDAKRPKEGTTWKGYVEPKPYGGVTNPRDSGEIVPRFRAISRSEMH